MNHKDLFKPVDVPDKDLDDFIFKPKRKISMKRIWNAIRATLAGENKVGEFIHGLLDDMPIANQIVAKFFKAIGKEGDEKLSELKDILTIRNGVALIATILILNGYLSWETLSKAIDVFKSVLAVF